MTHKLFRIINSPIFSLFVKNKKMKSSNDLHIASRKINILHNRLTDYITSYKLIIRIHTFQDSL